jgi:NAD(P)-dependent dehydrogenase (short-subunit alcohol dehydrogenase family)
MPLHTANEVPALSSQNRYTPLHIAIAGSKARLPSLQVAAAASALGDLPERLRLNAIAVAADVSKNDDLTRLFDKTAEAFGKVDVVVAKFQGKTG